MSIEVVKPGILSSFQDLGRHGYQHLGVPLNGVMDERSHRIANWMVGNAAHEATLEITLMGPTLRFEVDAVIAVGGADLSPKVDGEAMPMHAAVAVKAGSTLAFGTPRGGIRAYLAVRGGYELAPVMRSASTNLRAGFGGAEGAILKKGAHIGLRNAGRNGPMRRFTDLPPMSGALMPPPGSPLRIVPGREHDGFSAEAIEALGSQAFKISPQSDRMGYRLDGPALTRSGPRDILSEALLAGTIQVPPSGQPIVLMADCQTTGGYPRIANLAGVDIPRLAQRAPGEVLRFEWLDLAQAQRLAVAQARVYRLMEQQT